MDKPWDDVPAFAHVTLTIFRPISTSRRSPLYLFDEDYTNDLPLCILRLIIWAGFNRTFFVWRNKFSFAGQQELPCKGSVQNMDGLQVLFKERFSGVSGDGQTIALCAARPHSLMMSISLICMSECHFFYEQQIASVKTSYNWSSNVHQLFLSSCEAWRS